jgi:tRNA modification GTPase
MYIEASLDFPEEEIDFISDGNVLHKLESLFAQLKSILAKATQGAMVREGLQIVIIGKPNAGKSTIINQLSGQETAIVTSIAGTTRDILREKILINDIPIHVVDTAGLRNSLDEIEQEGIRRAKNAALSADLILLVVEHQNSSDRQIEEFIAKEGITGPLLIAINKIDQAAIKPHITDNKVFISAKEGAGIDLLKSKILNLAGVNQKEAQGSYLARRRHLNALEKSLELLTTGLNNLKTHHAGELLAEDLKQAHSYLCQITGEFSADDLLGEIFSSFCIGK